MKNDNPVSNYTMSPEAANDSFKKVLDACGRTDSPDLSAVMSDVSKRRGQSKIPAIVGLVLLVLTFIIPLFLSPGAGWNKKSNSTSSIVIKSFDVDGSRLQFDLSGQTIDYSSAYAINSSGKTFSPSSTDIIKGRIIFDDYDGSEWNIYIEDLSGETSHMLLSPPQ